jgi:hypothetical protein
VCPECTTALVAVKGDIRQHHFRHNVDPTICQHAQETGLHRYAKQIICERLELALPHDLGPMKSARSEVWMDGIIPDVLADYEQESIAIEIWVAHRVERRKIEIFNNRKLAALEIDLRKYRWADRTEEEWIAAILHSAPRMWLLPPLQVRLQYEQRAFERAEARRLQIEEADRQWHAAEAERIARESELEQLRRQQAADDLIQKHERDAAMARRREAAIQQQLENEKIKASDEAEHERTRAVRLAHRRQQQQDRLGPVLENLISAHGGYSKITPEAWAAHDKEMTAWKTRMKFGDFSSIPDDPPLPIRPFNGLCHCGAGGLYVSGASWFCQQHKPDFRQVQFDAEKKDG